MKSLRTEGFSLIDLMVAVVIVGILAAVAMPSYSSHVIKGARVAAQTELLELSSLQEKIYLNSNPNAYVVTTAAVSAAYVGTTLGGLGKTGGTTSDNKYIIALSGTGQTYTLTATPATNIQQSGDGCLTLQENGLRQWHENNDACNSAAPRAW